MAMVNQAGEALAIVSLPTWETTADVVNSNL